jgi:hypothetical protein
MDAVVDGEVGSGGDPRLATAIRGTAARMATEAANFIDASSLESGFQLQRDLAAASAAEPRPERARKKLRISISSVREIASRGADRSEGRRPVTSHIDIRYRRSILNMDLSFFDVSYW